MYATYIVPGTFFILSVPQMNAGVMFGDENEPTMPACSWLLCVVSPSWGRPERGGANYHPMEGHGDAGYPRRAKKNGGPLCLGRRSLGDGVGGGP